MSSLSPVERLTAACVAIEAAAVLVLCVVEFVALLGGDTSAADSSIALLVLTVILFAALSAFAVAILRDQSWGRSGAIVVQLLLIAVGLGATTGAFAHPLLGVILGAPGLVVGILLVLSVRAASRRLRAGERE